MARDRPVDVETLLAHEAFVRSLARRLVGEGDEADEIAQETLVRAMAHPPQRRRGIVGWLATVARNVVRERRRGDRRRARREAAVARPDVVPSTERILEREIARRTVVEAVLELDEPYRTVVVLRWLEGLPPREVAARLAIPVETVRTRSRRAIEQLRARLDRRHGGRRDAWLAALLPLADGPPSPSPAAPRGFPTAALAAAAIGAVAIVAFVARPGGEPSSGSDRDAGGGLAARSDDPDSTPRTADPEERMGHSTLLAAVPSTGPGTVRGFVLEPGRRPAEGAHVTVRRVAAAPSGTPTREATTDAQGRFEVSDVPIAAYVVEASTATGARGGALVRAARDPAWATVWLGPAASATVPLWVRVLGTDGEPVPGARVDVASEDGRTSITSRTSANGYALAEVQWPSGAGRAVVEASAAGGLARRHLTLPALRGDGTDAFAIDLEVRPAGRLEGRVEAPEGVPLGSSRLVLWPASLDEGAPGTLPRVRETPLTEDGSFRLDGLAPDAYAVGLRSPAGLRIDPTGRGRPDGAGTVRVEVGAGRTTSISLRTVAGAAIRGVVSRADTGKPLAGARVEWTAGPAEAPTAEAAARLDPEAPAAADLGVRDDRRVAVTDAEGRYEVRGLAAHRSWRARVRPRDGEDAVEVLEDVRLADATTREVLHRVRAAGTLVAVLEPGTAFGLRPPEASSLVLGLAPREGAAAGEVRLAGLAPGPWEILAFPAGPRAPFSVARFEIAAGGTARIDAPAASEVKVRGRVTQAGRPVEGAWVSTLGLGSRPTGPDGRYEFQGPVGVPMFANTTVRAPGPDGVELRRQMDCMVLGTGVIEEDLLLPEGTVEARVVDPSGRPVAGALARIRPPRGEAEGTGLSPARTERVTDVSGHARWAGLPPGPYAVEARIPASGARVEAPAEVGTGSRVVRVELREPPTGRLRVVVLDEAGRPVPGAHVRRIGPESVGDPLGDPTDADGATVLRGLPAGAVRLVVVRHDAGQGGAAIAEFAPVEGDVVAGEQRELTARRAPAPHGGAEGGPR